MQSIRKWVMIVDEHAELTSDTVARLSAIAAHPTSPLKQND